jgi:hypothetical protein
MLHRRLHLLLATITIAITIHSRAMCVASEDRKDAAVEGLSQINSVRDLQQIFAPREVDVEILGMDPPEEFSRLQSAFTESIEKNQRWFLEYAKANAAGGPLPYHENFGITKAEYERFLKLMIELKLVPIAKGRLRFSRKSDDQILIEGVDGLHEFNETVIDFKQEHVATRWGTVPLDRPTHAGEGSALGRWDGFSGDLTTGVPEDGTASRVSIKIGRQVATSLSVFCLSVRVVENGEKTVNVESMVRFP